MQILDTIRAIGAVLVVIIW